MALPPHSYNPSGAAAVPNFEFTWSGLNKATKRLDPIEEVCFGGTLNCILYQVLTSDPCLGPFYISKVNMDDMFMRLWVMMEEVPFIAFLITKRKTSETQLVGFHLSLPMVYINSAHYFYMDTKTLADLSNAVMDQNGGVQRNPL